MSELFPLTALGRWHAQTVRYNSSSYEIDYFIVIKNFQNPKRHQNPISGSKVTDILLKGWIWPIDGVVSGRVCACSQRGRLVNIQLEFFFRNNTFRSLVSLSPLLCFGFELLRVCPMTLSPR